MTPPGPRAQRPQPGPARLPRARRVRRDPYAGLVEAVHGARRGLGFDVEVRETNDEAEMIRWLHEAADGRSRSFSTPALHALLVRHA